MARPPERIEALEEGSASRKAEGIPAGTGLATSELKVLEFLVSQVSKKSSYRLVENLKNAFRASATLLLTARGDKRHVILQQILSTGAKIGPRLTTRMIATSVARWVPDDLVEMAREFVAELPSPSRLEWEFDFDLRARGDLLPEPLGDPFAVRAASLIAVSEFLPSRFRLATLEAALLSADFIGAEGDSLKYIEDVKTQAISVGAAGQSLLRRLEDRISDIKLRLSEQSQDRLSHSHDIRHDVQNSFEAPIKEEQSQKHIELKLRDLISSDPELEASPYKSDLILSVRLAIEEVKAGRSPLILRRPAATDSPPEGVSIQVGPEAFNESGKGSRAEPPSPSASEELPRLELSPADRRAVLKRGKSHPWRDRKSYHMSPIDFVRETYVEWAGKGLTLAFLRHADPSLYRRIVHWARIPGNTIPPGLLPKESELTDAAAELAARRPDALSPKRRASVQNAIAQRQLRAVSKKPADR